MQRLSVWLHGKLAGFLETEDNDHFMFTYSKAYMASPKALPLSCSLPFQTEAYGDVQARAFFAGLLPEESIRILVARALHVSEKNDFRLLNALGGECAGAVTLLQEDEVPENTEQRIDWMTEEGLLSVLKKAQLRPFMAGQKGVRLSLAGAQHKIPLCYDGERFGIPLGSTPSTHILKQPVAGVEQSVQNEYFCLHLAKSLSLPVAQSSIVSLGDTDFLLVERYDRDSVAGKSIRRHQEDFCQALGYSSSKKYQSDGGPGFKECFALVRNHTKPSAVYIKNLLNISIFNMLVGNNDAHAKNFSLLYSSKGHMQLAPFYDLLSTAAYEHIDNRMAMKIGCKNIFSDIYPRHMDKFCDEIQIKKSFVIELMSDMINRLPANASAIAEDIPSIGNAICVLINTRCALLRKRFSM